MLVIDEDDTGEIVFDGEDKLVGGVGQGGDHHARRSHGYRDKRGDAMLERVVDLLDETTRAQAA